MLLPLRNELIGEYATPCFKIGDVLNRAIRGPVRVVKTSDEPSNQVGRRGNSRPT